MRLHHLVLLLALFVPSCSLGGGAPGRSVQRPRAAALTAAPVKKCAERKSAAQPIGRAAPESGRSGQSVSAS
jgi:hypothetical protein